jgi:hypothetical protein
MKKLTEVHEATSAQSVVHEATSAKSVVYEATSASLVHEATSAVRANTSTNLYQSLPIDFSSSYRRSCPAAHGVEAPESPDLLEPSDSHYQQTQHVV